MVTDMKTGEIYCRLTVHYGNNSMSRKMEWVKWSKMERRMLLMLHSLGNHQSNLSGDYTADRPNAFRIIPKEFEFM